MCFKDNWLGQLVVLFTYFKESIDNWLLLTNYYPKLLCLIFWWLIWLSINWNLLFYNFKETKIEYLKKNSKHYIKIAKLHLVSSLWLDINLI